MARRQRTRTNSTPFVLVALVIAAVLGLRFADRQPGAGPPPPAGPAADSPPAPAGGPSNATVVQAVDGDTLEADVGGTRERVRLIGIDTPESVATDRPNECFGREASAHLGELLPPGTAIRLERDVEARDRYGRLLGYVYRSSDGLFANHDLVAGGFAEASAYPPNTARQGDFDVAQVEARRARAGLWGACGHADVPLPGQ